MLNYTKSVYEIRVELSRDVRMCKLDVEEATDMSTSGSKVKAPTSDDTVLQKVTAVKVSALVASLKGFKELQAGSEADRRNYDNGLKITIERRYGSDHIQQMFQKKLTNCSQRKNKTLLEYVAEIYRLAHLAYAKETSGFHKKYPRCGQETGTLVDTEEDVCKNSVLYKNT